MFITEHHENPIRNSVESAWQCFLPNLGGAHYTYTCEFCELCLFVPHHPRFNSAVLKEEEGSFLLCACPQFNA